MSFRGNHPTPHTTLRFTWDGHKKNLNIMKLILSSLPSALWVRNNRHIEAWTERQEDSKPKHSRMYPKHLGSQLQYLECRSVSSVQNGGRGEENEDEEEERKKRRARRRRKEEDDQDIPSRHNNKYYLLYGGIQISDRTDERGNWAEK